MMAALCSCSLFDIVDKFIVSGADIIPVYDEMPVSGDGTEFGSYTDSSGFIIVNRAEYVHPSGYEPHNTPFSYLQLSSERQKELYDKIYDACYCFSDKPSDMFDGEYAMRPLVLEGDYADIEAEEALVSVLNDHPEIFWMTSDFYISEFSGYGKCELNLNTDYTALDVVEMMKQLNDALADFYDGVPSGLTPYEREVYVYSRIIDSCVYDYAVEDDESYSYSHPQLYNLYGVLVNNTAVCEGYARAFDYLCGELGVETVCVTGTEEGDEEALHIWNAVMLDGKWYLSDITWDDWDDESDELTVYTYLNIDEKTMNLDHTTDKTYSELSDEEYNNLVSYCNTFIPSPCDSAEYSYIMRESIYLDSLSVDKLSDGISKAALQNKDYFMIYVDPDFCSLEDAELMLFDGSQPYYEAMDSADISSDGVIDTYADASYYVIEERNLLVFELIYE